MKKSAAFTALFLFASMLGLARPPKEVEFPRGLGRNAISQDGLSSLRGLSDSQLIEFMGPGKTKWDREQAEKDRDRRAVPDRFWDLPPRNAALAFLEINQGAEDRPAYALSLDAGSDLPPGKGTLVFCRFSDRSYNDVRSYYFLRFDPEGSYLAFARTWYPGQVGFDFVAARTAYDFRFCELSFKEALHFAQVVWWLTKAGTKRAAGRISPSELVFEMSSSDAQGRLKLIPEDGGRPTLKAGWLGVGSPVLWKRMFDGTACLNAASFAVQRILVDHLGRRWTDLESGDADDPSSIAWGERDLTASRMSYLIEMTSRFLRLWSPDETKVSSWHAAAAAQAAGDLALVQLVPVLEAIPKTLPLPQPSVKRPRTEDELHAEILKLRELADPDEYKEKVNALMEEDMRRNEEMPDSGREARDELNDTVNLALRKIKVAADLPALKKWAKTRSDGSTWAAARILERSPRDYAGVLESWMAKASPEQKNRILRAIFRGCPERAVEIAAKVPAGKTNDLRLTAAEILSNAGRIPGGKDSPDALINIVRDKRAGWDERSEAIQLLVPRENPGRFSGRAIDDSLLAILNEEASKGPDPQGPVADAVVALSWRRRSDLKGVLWSVLKAQGAASIDADYSAALSAVTYLTRHAGPPEKEDLARTLAPDLLRSDDDAPISEILWSAWSADLRELGPEIEKIATSSPAEEEAPGGRRFHLARKIAALWRKKDLVTQGKLLIAFGLGERSLCDSEALEREEQMKEALGRLAKEASPDDLAGISNFLAWCESDVVGHDPRGFREAEESFVRLAREALGLSSREAD